MNNQEKQLRNWKALSATLAVITLITIVTALVFIVRGIGAPKAPTEVESPAPSTSEQTAETEPVLSPEATELTEAAETTAPVEEVDALSLWTSNAEAKKALVSYVENVTDENSPDYIPVEDRIAVFDMDGTILCETDPYYFDHCLLVYRVLEDPNYKDKASTFEKDVATRLQAKFDGDSSIEVSMIEHGQAVAMAFAGMTIDEFEAYVEDFKNQPAPGYNNMTRGEAFYKPMIQVIDYLQANDFTVYIVSGTDRLIVRGLIKGSVDIPRNQLIGSDELLVATGQGDVDGMEYTFTDQDKLVTGGQFIIKTLDMNKVTAIMTEIGIQPVLSFGNSTGDSAMAEFTTTNNKYKSLAFMLCCDDLVRENGNTAKADKMRDLCKEFGWIPISMRDDWTTIYGDDVTRKI